jgi:diguanylate cyclase (GGDEF)-like protein
MLSRVGDPPEARRLIETLMSHALEEAADDHHIEALAGDYAEASTAAEPALRQLGVLATVLVEALFERGESAVVSVVSAVGLAESVVGVDFVRAAELAARRDVLTGLENRRVFDEDVGGAERRCVEHGGSFVLASLDLDGLKQVNDTHGHHAGDEYLQKFAAALRTYVPDGARAYRWGGDEFAVIFRHETAGDAEAALLAVSRVADVPPFSWGIASCPTDSLEVKAVERLADERMYERKAERKKSAASPD